MQSVSRKVITCAHQEAVEDLAGKDVGAIRGLTRFV
jgi:hypothetical protein